jgi:hypothetical protein
MKKISNLLFIVITIIGIYFLSCSKKSTTTTTTTTQTCSTPSACLENTWYQEKYQAIYNGSPVTIYQRGANSNLLDFDSVEWVFENNNNAWYIYSSSTSIFESGTWKILPDSIVEITATNPDTFAITSITPSALNFTINFNHNYPNYDIVQIAAGSGLDTSKITAVLSTFSTSK